MFLRVSLFTSILSVAVTGSFFQSASADWYGIEIRSREQAAMEAAEKQTTQFNLPKSAWHDQDVQSSGESKPNDAGKLKPEASVSDAAPAEEEVAQVVDNVWHASTSKSTETTPQVVEEVEITNVTKEATVESSTSVSLIPPAIDQEVAKDVDHLLNQKEEWFAPLAGAEEASQKLENVSFEESPNVSESMTYLDELRELDAKESHWIQSSVVLSDRDLDVDFASQNSLMTTQPIFMNELEAMASRNRSPELEAYSHLAELEELRANQTLNVSSTNQMLVQADGYNPAAKSGEEEKTEQLKSLFPSITAIQVTGTSTTPREAVIKKHPENLAAAHMQKLIPGEYVMGPVMGVAAPSRYPVCFQHNPLYFEDPNLERCGVSHGCFTTTVSAARFLGSTFALPYLVIATPPRTCLATLGDCPTCAEFDTDAYLREWKWNR